jgi:hypothetical protein
MNYKIPNHYKFDLPQYFFLGKGDTFGYILFIYSWIILCFSTSFSWQIKTYISFPWQSVDPCSCQVWHCCQASLQCFNDAFCMARGSGRIGKFFHLMLPVFACLPVLNVKLSAHFNAWQYLYIALSNYNYLLVTIQSCSSILLFAWPNSSCISTQCV